MKKPGYDELERQLNELRQQLEDTQARLSTYENNDASATQRGLASRLQSTFDSVSDGLLVVDLQGNIIDANSSFLRMYRIADASELRGKTAFEFADASCLAAVTQGIEDTLKHGMMRSIDVTAKRADGTLFPAEANTALFLGPDGKSAGIVAQIRDMTAQKQAIDTLRKSEEELKRTKDFLQCVIDEIPQPLAVKDINHRWILINRAICEIFNKPREELIGKTDYDFIRKEEADIFREREIEIFKTGEPNINEEMLTEPGGRIRWQVAEKKLFTDAEGYPYLLAIAFDISKLREVQDELRRKDAYYASLMEHIQDIIMVVDENSDITYLCPAITKYFGYDPLEPVGTSSFNYVHPEDIQSASLAFVQALANPGEVVKADIRMRKKTGEYVCMAGIGSCAVDPSGKKYIVINGRDVTERNAAQEALRISEDRYRALLDSSPDGITITGLDGIITECSLATATLHGFSSKEEILGKNALEFLSPADIDIANSHMRNIIESGKTKRVELFLRHKNGTFFPCSLSVSLIKDARGTPTGFIGITKDITERKRNETMLQESEEKYRRIVDTANEGICAIDGDYRISFINKRMCEMMGYGHEELIGKKMESFYFEEDKAEIKENMDKGRKGILVKCERRIRHKDGSVLWTFLSPAQLVDNDGNLQGLMAMFTDITRWKETEQEKESLRQQLLHAQKLEAIGRLAGGIAHNFNNILSVIIGTSELAIRNMPPGDPGLARIQRIVTVSTRAKDLTMKLLTFARKEKLDIRAISPESLISELTDMLKRSIPENIKIRTRAAQSNSALSVDFNQILQAMLNICNNACDAMPDGGLLSIETSEAFLDDSHCEKRPGLTPGKYCIVEIRDTGHGFDPQIKQKLFEPFFTTKAQGKGTGLGLSISLGIIQSHKGHIDIDSAPGEGTTIRLYLPAIEPVEEPPGTEQKETDKKKHKATILVVDDDSDVLNMLAEILAIEGFNAIPANSGIEALEIYRKAKDSIDLVILDMIMPGMDGNEIFVELKKCNPDVKAILCSGQSIDEQARKIIEEGIEGYLQKPFSSQELFRVISRTMAF